MKAKNDLSNRVAIRALVLAFVVGCFSLGQVLAQTSAAPSSSSTLNALGRSSGNTFTLGSYPIDTSNLARHSPFKGSANGGLLTDLVDNYKPANSTTIPVKATSRLPPLAVGKALGRFAAKSLPILGSAAAFLDLLDELGLTYDSSNPPATPFDKQLEAINCADGICTEYFSQVSDGGWHTTARAASEEWAVWANANNNSYDYSIESCPSLSTCIWKGVSRADGVSTIRGERIPATRTVAPTTGGSTTEISIPQFEAEVESKLSPSAEAGGVNAPIFEKASRALEAAIKAGESVLTQPETLTGPASQPVSKSETTRTTEPQPATATSPATAGSTFTTTNTVINNYYYSGPTITTNTKITNVTRNSSGQIVDSDTTDSEAPPSETKPDAVPPEDPCLKNPERLGCLEIDTPEGEIPRDVKNITYQAETPFGEGTCPANLTTHLATLDKTITVWDWSKTCQLAFPLRALVLALASFAAFLIIMPGKVET